MARRRDAASANRDAAAAGWRGARGGTRGAARAQAAYEAKHGAGAARRAERMYQQGIGSAANDSQAAWRRYQRTEQYKRFRDRAMETARDDKARRAARRWDSDFNTKYRDAVRAGFRRDRYGAFHRLLVQLQWREGGANAPAWGAGNTPRGRSSHVVEIEPE